MDNVNSLCSKSVQGTSGWMKWSSLIVLIFAQLGTLLDLATIQVSAEALTAELNASMPELQFANATYAMVAASLMVVGGFTGLIIGWRRQLKLGLGIVAIGALAAAFSPSMSIFILFGRGLTAVGACLLIPSVLAHIPAIYQGRDRAVAFSLVAASLGILAAIAPVLQGAIVDLVGFRAAYLIVSLYFVAVFILTRFLAPLTIEKQPVKMDIVGILLGTLGLLSIIVGLLKVAQWGVISPISNIHVFGYSPALPLVAIGALILVCFGVWERHFETKHHSALLPQSFLKNKVVLTGFYMMLASNLTISAMAFLVIIYLQFSVGLSAALSGLTFGILAIGLIVGSIVTPKLLQALSRRAFGSVIFVSLGLSIISLVVGVEVNSFTWLGYLGLAITGLSCGFMMSFAPVLVTSSLSERDAQQSGGMQATAKNIGSALGIAISGSVLLLSLTGSVKSGLEDNELVSTETKELILQQSTIPFLTHDNAALSLQKVNVTQADITHIQPAYEKAKLHSFQAAISSTLVFAFIGLALIARLPRTEPKT